MRFSKPFQRMFPPMALVSALLFASAAVAQAKPATTAAPAAKAGPAAAEMDANAVIGAALAHRRAGRFERAFAALKGLVDADGSNERAHHELAVLYAIHGQLGDAARHLQIALVLNPAAVASRRNLAEVLRADGKHAAALPHYGAVQGQPDSRVAALRGMALCQEALGQTDAARATLATLAREFGGDANGRWAAGHLATLDQLRSQGNVAPEVADRQGRRLFDEGRHAAAEAWFGFAFQRQASADRAFRLAMARLALRDYLGAVAAFQTALRLTPGHKAAMAAYPTAVRKLRSVGEGGRDVSLAAEGQGTPMARAAAALLRGEFLLTSQIAKAGQGGRYKGLVLRLLGAEADLRSGRVSKAQAALLAVLKDRPGHSTATQALAEAAYLRGQHSEARRLAGLANPPRNPALSGLDVADLVQFVRWRRAYVDAQLAMAIDPVRRPAGPFQLVEGPDPEAMISAKPSP